MIEACCTEYWGPTNLKSVRSSSNNPLSVKVNCKNKSINLILKNFIQMSAINVTYCANKVTFRGGTKPDQTSALLLAIVLVFLITEMPQGIIAIMNAIYTTHVHIYIYFNLGDILDLLSLLNSSITFILYCLMSSRLVAHRYFFQNKLN